METHLLGGSWNLAGTVISTFTGVISSYRYRYLIFNSGLLSPVNPKPYSKPQKVGNRIKDNQCWDPVYMVLKD